MEICFNCCYRSVTKKKDVTEDFLEEDKGGGDMAKGILPLSPPIVPVCKT
jgi:hypothetical protein